MIFINYVHICDMDKCAKSTKWLKIEDARLRRSVGEYLSRSATVDWNEIALALFQQSRSASQCRERWDLLQRTSKSKVLRRFWQEVCLTTCRAFGHLRKTALSPNTSIRLEHSICCLHLTFARGVAAGPQLLSIFRAALASRFASAGTTTSTRRSTEHRGR